MRGGGRGDEGKWSAYNLIVYCLLFIVVISAIHTKQKNKKKKKIRDLLSQD